RAKKLGVAPATPAQEVGEDTAEFTASLGQRVLDARRRVGRHAAQNQSGLLQITEPRSKSGRADGAEPISQLVEPDHTAIGDQAQKTERVAPAHHLGERCRRAQAVPGGELCAAAAGGRALRADRYALPRHSPPPEWQLQSAVPHSPWA